MADLDLAGENFLEHGLNGAIPIGPICADEVNARCREKNQRENQTESPELHFVSPELRFAPRFGRMGRYCRQWSFCHGIEVPMKPLVEAIRSKLRLDWASRAFLGRGSHQKSLLDPTVMFDADQ